MVERRQIPLDNHHKTHSSRDGNDGIHLQPDTVFTGQKWWYTPAVWHTLHRPDMTIHTYSLTHSSWDRNGGTHLQPGTFFTGQI